MTTDESHSEGHVLVNVIKVFNDFFHREAQIIFCFTNEKERIAVFYLLRGSEVEQSQLCALVHHLNEETELSTSNVFSTKIFSKCSVSFIFYRQKKIHVNICAVMKDLEVIRSRLNDCCLLWSQCLIGEKLKRLNTCLATFINGAFSNFEMMHSSQKRLSTVSFENLKMFLGPEVVSKRFLTKRTQAFFANQKKCPKFSRIRVLRRHCGSLDEWFYNTWCWTVHIWVMSNSVRRIVNGYRSGREVILQMSNNSSTATFFYVAIQCKRNIEKSDKIFHNNDNCNGRS